MDVCVCVTSFITFYFVFWDRVSRWTSGFAILGLAIWLDWLVVEPQGVSGSAPNTAVSVGDDCFNVLMFDDGARRLNSGPRACMQAPYPPSWLLSSLQLLVMMQKFSFRLFEHWFYCLEMTRCPLLDGHNWARISFAFNSVWHFYLFIF